jgi:hypothetical protein
MLTDRRRFLKHLAALGFVVPSAQLVARTYFIGGWFERDDSTLLQHYLDTVDGRAFPRDDYVIRHGVVLRNRTGIFDFGWSRIEMHGAEPALFVDNSNVGLTIQNLTIDTGPRAMICGLPVLVEHSEPLWRGATQAG